MLQWLKKWWKKHIIDTCPSDLEDKEFR